jgi:hypothetical protein
VSETYCVLFLLSKDICWRIQDDGMKLFRDYGILASNLIELGALGCQVDGSFQSTFKRPIVALAKVVSFCLRKTLDKGPVRTSDWSKDLTRNQMKCTYSVKPGRDRLIGFSRGSNRCLQRCPLRIHGLQVSHEDGALVQDTTYARTLHGRPGD